MLENMVEEIKEEQVKNLATVQKIESLTPIEGADKIEVAKMENLEWRVVVQKGIHQVGDLVCYVGIDTVVDPLYVNNDIHTFAFLEKAHYRIKTIRLRKQLSQGIIFQLKELGPIFEVASLEADLTQLLNVKKYEKPIPANLRGKIKGNFPTKYVPITDEERLQNCSRILEELNGVKGYVSVKLDGTSATYISFLPEGLTDVEQHVCSRRLSLKAPVEGDAPNVYFNMEQKYDILAKLKAKGNYAIQGEICGPGIQGNKMGLKEVDFFLFNVVNISERRFLNFDEFMAFAKELGLNTVEIIDSNFDFTGRRFDELIQMADGLYANGTLREGIVFRPLIEMYSEYMKGRVSFKAVSNKFLEHYKE